MKNTLGNSFCTRTHFAILLLYTIILYPVSIFAQTQEPPTYDDPFYKQKGTDKFISELSTSLFQNVAESVDPFNGNLNLLHTDVSLPGNGGLDLKIQRTYNSRIWGRKDVSNPGLVAVNERSVMGIGWSFHFGRVLNPAGTGSSNRNLPNNPVIEMADGSNHPLYQDKNVAGQKISREYWIYKLNTSTSKYELTLTDGTVYTFAAAQGYLTADNVQVYQVGSIKTTNGNTITFTYDSADPRLVTSITDSDGRVATFSYSNNSGIRLLSSITVNGKTYNYFYQLINGMYFLTEARPPVGPSWTYTYRSANPGLYELQTVTYPSGAVLTYTYSDVTFDTGPVSIPFTVVTRKALSGRGLTSTAWDYSYSANTTSNQITTVTQSGCATERYTYASFGPLGSSGLSNNLWKIGSMLKKEILDGSTVVQTENYTWSPSATISTDDISNGNWNGLIGQLYDDGIFVPQLTSKAVTRDGKTYTTSYSNYDVYSNPRTISETGDAGRSTTLTYFSNTSKNIVKGHPATKAVTVGSETFTTQYSYDSNGNLTSLNEYGVITGFGFTSGNLTSRTDARNNTTTFQYTRGKISRITNPLYSINRTINWEGTIASETNGRGNTTSFTYDSLNRLTRIDPPVETITTITYDNSSASFHKVQQGVTFTQFDVDGLGRLTGTSDSEGIHTDTNYNTCGQKSYQSYPYTSSNIGDNFIYDVLDRVTRVTHPDAKTQNYSYSGGNLSLTNERNITITYNQKAFGDPNEKRLSSISDATGTTTYTYNTLGSLTNISHPGGLSRTFSYNTKNFLTSETHPETGTISYGRDNLGNMISKTDGKGTTNFTYDALNRLTNIDYPGTADDTSITYDNADNRTVMSSSAANYSYIYDSENLLTQRTVTIGGRNFVTSYGYDSRGNRTSITYPTGRTINYSYDSDNRVSSLSGYVTNVTYHPSGGMASLTYANGKTTTFGYNNRYRVSTMSTPSVLNFTYSYDGVGNVTNIVDGINGSRNRAMVYDNVDRLTNATGIWGTLSFGYDALGNRASKTINSSTTTYNYSSNRLSSVSGGQTGSFSYDSNGNIIAMRGLTLAYDPANRLINVNSGSTTYTYDGDGNRIKKVNNTTGKTVIYHYDGGKILAETDTNGGAIAEYLYVNGQHVVKIETDNTAPIISAVASNSVTYNAATIAWSTDEVSDSQVEYGTTTAYGSSTPINSNSVTSHSVNLSGLTASTLYHYRVKSKDAFGNLATSGDFTFTTSASPDTQAPTVPLNFIAAASSTTQNNLSWTASSDNVGVDHYEVERKSNGGAYSLIASPTTASFTDSSVTAGISYVYRVRAFDTAGNASVYSNIDLATTILFTDDPLISGTTTVKAQHLTELRQAVSALWSSAGLPGTPVWTDQFLGGIFIKAVHIQELRDNLNTARSALGLTVPSYTDPTLTAGSTVVKRVHIEELRLGVK